MRDLTYADARLAAAAVIDDKPEGTMEDVERALNSCGLQMQFSVQSHIEGRPWWTNASELWFWYPASHNLTWLGDDGEWRPDWRFKPCTQLADAYRVATNWLARDPQRHSFKTLHPTLGRPTWLFTARIDGKSDAAGTFYGEHANHATALLEAILGAHLGTQLRLVDDLAQKGGAA